MRAIQVNVDLSKTAIYKRCVAHRLVVALVSVALSKIATCKLSAEQKQNSHALNSDQKCLGEIQ